MSGSLVGRRTAISPLLESRIRNSSEINMGHTPQLENFEELSKDMEEKSRRKGEEYKVSRLGYKGPSSGTDRTRELFFGAGFLIHTVVDKLYTGTKPA